MYFDPRPKVKREDLYDREEELKRFSDALDYSPMIVVVGPRRTGKTSFLNVALGEANTPFIFMDLRELPYNPSRADIVRRLESGLNKIDRKWFHALAAQVRHLKGIQLLGSSISLDWSKEGVSLPELFDRINEWAEKNKKRFIAAFDEIQAIRGEKELLRLFAHVTDIDRNIVIVLTGSEVGLLFGFLSFDEPKSPLYGRHYTEIKMRNLTRDESTEFLRAGFRQIEVECPEDIIRQAVDGMDGVIGWLTLFGARCRDAGGCSGELVEETIREGGKLARSEAMRLVEYSPRYGAILNLLSTVPSASWTQIKGILEAKEGRALSSHAVTTLLDRLTQLNLVEKVDSQYTIADPILRAGIQEEKLPEQTASEH